MHRQNSQESARFGIVVIGDEILRGKRQDRHFPYAIQALKAIGHDLSWARFIGDEDEIIVATLHESLRREDIVFCFGGIGATPDDLTRQCAATAAGVSMVRHTEAVAEIEAQYGENAYPHRILMADLPQGARIIPNPVNRVPGFSLGRHHFMPGFPHMAHPMLDWVLANEYAHLANTAPAYENSVHLFDAHESQLLDVMQRIVKTYPAIRLSSLPKITDGVREIEFSLRGEKALVEDAMTVFKQELATQGVQWQPGKLG